MPNTPDEMLSAVSQSLAARTGRSLQEWVDVVRSSGLDPLDQAAVRGLAAARARSATEQPVGDRRRRVLRAAGWVPPTVTEYVDRQYAGAKAALRPVYQALAAAITELGEDVTVEGRGTYIPFVRGLQFAAVAAAARDRVDLGLRFTDPLGLRRGCARAAGQGRPRTPCPCARSRRSTTSSGTC